MAQEDDDEWEYEYDENETENFYIPVDLAHVPKARERTTVPKTGHPMLLQNKLRAFNAGRKESERVSGLQDVYSSASMGEIQISGLHTANPLILYNGQLLSCQWTATIGTDLLFTKPNTEPYEGSNPLRSLPSVDLLATSSARLVGRVGRLRPRDALLEKGTEEVHTADNMDTSEEPQRIATNKNLPSEPMETDEQGSRRSPSGFLQRLNAAKAKRGDKSQLAVSKTSSGLRLVVNEEVRSSSGAEEAEDTVMSGT